MSSLATVEGKSLTANLLQKLFSERIFFVTIADTDNKSLKSLHTYFDHMLVKFEQNRLVRTI